MGAGVSILQPEETNTDCKGCTRKKKSKLKKSKKRERKRENRKPF